jgi:hypothetical protein
MRAVKAIAYACKTRLNAKFMGMNYDSEETTTTFGKLVLKLESIEGGRNPYITEDRFRYTCSSYVYYNAVLHHSGGRTKG